MMTTHASPLPKNATIMTITKKIGSDRTMSTKRMMRLSTQPPKKPAIAPRVTPIDAMIATAMKPMKSDVWIALHQAQEDVLADLVGAQGRRELWNGRRIVPRQARSSRSASPVRVGTMMARATSTAMRNRAMTASRCWTNRWRTSCQ